MDLHGNYMRRCLQLAALGAGRVAPNPMVGAVLVHNGLIIGDGWHRDFGAAHAEVNCIEQAISGGCEGLLSSSTLYVSLEPCAHFGKTPPCTDLILHHRIPKVVIAMRDPFDQVNGRGIERLRERGVEVLSAVLEEEAAHLNRRFIVFHGQKRPYIILKWAQTRDGIMGSQQQRMLISGPATNRLVHKWRAEEAAILVGRNTALADNPALTTRLWPGRSPVRLVIDMRLELPQSLRIFDAEAPLVVFNGQRHSINGNHISGKAVNYYRVNTAGSIVKQVGDALYALGIQSVIVEGGRRLLQSFIDENYWDEARIISSPAKAEIHTAAVQAPQLQTGRLQASHEVQGDIIEYLTPA